MKNAASKLRKRIMFEMPEETVTSGGSYTVEWKHFATVWAEIRPLKSQEIWRDEQLQHVASFLFRMRYFEGISARMRILYQKRSFNIRAIMNPDESGEFLEILAEEGVAI